MTDLEKPQRKTGSHSRPPHPHLVQIQRALDPWVLFRSRARTCKDNVVISCKYPSKDTLTKPPIRAGITTSLTGGRALTPRWSLKLLSFPSACADGEWKLPQREQREPVAYWDESSYLSSMLSLSSAERRSRSHLMTLVSRWTAGFADADARDDSSDHKRTIGRLYQKLVSMFVFFNIYLDCRYPSWLGYSHWCNGTMASSRFGLMRRPSVLQPSSPRAPWLTAVFLALPGLWAWPWALRFAVDTWGHAGRRRVIMRRRPGLLLPNLPSSSFVSLPFCGFLAVRLLSGVLLPLLSERCT